MARVHWRVNAIFLVHYDTNDSTRRFREDAPRDPIGKHAGDIIKSLLELSRF